MDSSKSLRSPDPVSDPGNEDWPLQADEDEFVTDDLNSRWHQHQDVDSPKSLGSRDPVSGSGNGGWPPQKDEDGFAAEDPNSPLRMPRYPDDDIVIYLWMCGRCRWTNDWGRIVCSKCMHVYCQNDCGIITTDDLIVKSIGECAEKEEGEGQEDGEGEEIQATGSEAVVSADSINPDLDKTEWKHPRSASEIIAKVEAIETDQDHPETTVEKQAEALETSANLETQTEVVQEPRRLESKTDGSELPIRFTDAVWRKFNFPFHLCRTWQVCGRESLFLGWLGYPWLTARSWWMWGMEELIQAAFLNVDPLRDQVMKGHYNLIDPNGEIILPEVWEKVITPGSSVVMEMWPGINNTTVPQPKGSSGMPKDPRQSVLPPSSFPSPFGGPEPGGSGGA